MYPPPGGSTEPLSIGIILHDFALGGTERVAIRLGNRWAEDGHDVHLLVGHPHGPLEGLPGEGIAVATPPATLARARGSRRRLGAWAGAEAAARGLDIMFVPGNWHFATLRTLRAAAPDAAIVAKISNPVARASRGAAHQRMHQWLMRRRLAQTDAVVAMSPSLRQDAKPVAVQHRLHVISEPVLEDRPEEIAAESRQGLIAIGRLVKQKNFDIAIRALARLGRPEMSLTIVGDGPERQALTRLAAQLDVADRVTFTGCVDDVRPFLARAALLLLPSRFEGYPAVLVEALAQGVPVIATHASPALPEIVCAPRAGRIVASTPDAFAEAIGAYLDRSGDERETLPRLVDRHRIGPVATRYTTLFAGLKRERARRA